jgi:hypothetical protein
MGQRALAFQRIEADLLAGLPSRALRAEIIGRLQVALELPHADEDDVAAKQSLYTVINEVLSMATVLETGSHLMAQRGGRVQDPTIQEERWVASATPWEPDQDDQ